MMMITNREKFLMIQLGKAEKYYGTVEQWLDEVIDDAGHTVEQALSSDADQHARNLSERHNTNQPVKGQ
jgi:hypothetical protein